MLQKRRDRDRELGQLLLDNSPDDLEVDTEVVVDHFVTHAGNLFPGDLRLARFGRFGKILDGLSDNLQLPQRGVPAAPEAEPLD